MELWYYLTAEVGRLLRVSIFFIAMQCYVHYIPSELGAPVCVVMYQKQLQLGNRRARIDLSSCEINLIA